MKQMSTGFGLAVLGACVLGAAFIASPRFGQQAFAQVTGDRHIVSASVNTIHNGGIGMNEHFAYRIWSDNTIEMRELGRSNSNWNSNGDIAYWNPITNPASTFKSWVVADNGLTTFVPADVDANGSVDSSDLGNVLVNYGETQDGNPPPPIDCTINAPR
jgi:hypothetical protein